MGADLAGKGEKDKESLTFTKFVYITTKESEKSQKRLWLSGCWRWMVKIPLEELIRPKQLYRDRCSLLRHGKWASGGT
ncbi:hypothetical protein K2173_015703 [Erythroxylum novogranatense]|uniref:Uncharacterized protein n=1 Tax=Erythroxylum novogranatense TaxID=1862640 RepID=A0AAV8SEV0_9ROSI|nr:hypothetical protein K2173_015703 [Erythroxylum novogranatense]